MLQPLVKTDVDMNNLTVPGFYCTENNDIPSNAPTNGYNAAIIVLNGRKNVDIFQIWISQNAGKIFFRRRNAGNWTAWTEWLAM